MNKIDARGYSCPEPVFMTQQALANGLPLTVLVDSMIPVKNISRLVGNKGLKMEYQSIENGEFEITITEK